MAAITLTGTLTVCERKTGTDPDYLGMRKYSPNTERSLVWLNCCLTDDAGRRFFFNSPKVSMTVACVPGAAVCCYHVDGEAKNWFCKSGGSGVATAERPNTNTLESLLKVGDRITIRASVKQERPNYTQLCRVKLKLNQPALAS